MATLTTANCTLSLGVTGLYDTPQIIQGFATDDAFASESVKVAEFMRGVDGYASQGKLNNIYMMTIQLQADSPSLEFFETWYSAIEASRDVFWAFGTIFLPSIGRTYDLVNGGMESATPFPGVKKILEAPHYQLAWQQIIPSA